jgi:hypothetical protein
MEASTRSLLENQINALGSFPLTYGTISKWEDFEGSNLKAMLESSIEPIDSVSEQTIDSTKLNKKRRRPSDQGVPMVPWSFGEGQDLISSHKQFLQEQLFPKFSRPTTGSSDFTHSGNPMPRSGEGVNPLRGLSLLGDQNLGLDGTQQSLQDMSYHLDAAASLSSNPLMALSSFGGSHQFQADSHGLPHLAQLSSLGHTETPERCNLLPGTTQSIWDLEPNPITAPGRPV